MGEPASDTNSGNTGASGAPAPGSAQGGGGSQSNKHRGGPPNGGRGNGHGSRNNNNNHNISNGSNQFRGPKFEGRCTDLKGYIYDAAGARSADMYARTTKELAEYVGRTYDYGGDTRLAVLNLKMPTLEEPEDLDTTKASATKKRIWAKRVDEYVKKEAKLNENMKSLFSLVLGQCSEAMRAKLEALDEYPQISAKGDGLGLLKAIKSLVYNFQSQKYLPLALYEAERRLYTNSQARNTNQNYLEQFQNLTQVIEYCGGNIGVAPGITDAIASEKGYDPMVLSKDQKKEVGQRLGFGSCRKQRLPGL